MIKFSVIIPTNNRPKHLSDCLDSFFDLDYPEDAWELILVNDGGERSFISITDKYRSRLPVTLVEIDHGGPARARNVGAKRAQGEYLVFVDDDCRVDQKWLKAYETCFAGSPAAALGGRIMNPYPDNIPAETWSVYLEYLREQVMRDKDGNLLLLTSNNLAYRREIFESIGGFNEGFPFAAAEDSELGNRLVGYGHRQAFCPEAIIWHDHKQTYLGYLRQQFRYGRGNHYLLEIIKSKDIPAVERQKDSFNQSMKNLMSYSTRINAPLAMRFLLGATPFAFKSGNIYEDLRVQFKGK